MTMGWTLREPHRGRFIDAADYVAVAVALSLPWSTSATSILVALWVLLLLPTLDVSALGRELKTPAGGLPALLVVLAALGVLWADVMWAARIEGFISFLKLAIIPLLMVHFQRSQRGRCVIYALLAACVALLAASDAMTMFPSVLYVEGKNYGVVVKDYINQSGFFALAAFTLTEIALECWRNGKRLLAAALVVLIALFLANIVLVVTGRTTIMVMPVLGLLFGFRHARWKGLLAAGVVAAVVAGLAWSVSPYLRQRLQSTLVEQTVVGDHFEPSSTELRRAFWTASFAIARQAPLLGHGTGSIHAMFERYAAGHPNSLVDEATNPHNQTFAVAIQLGLVGTLLLYAMWLSHFWLFRGAGLVAWFGTAVVVQNFVSSLVNSHLFDFTQGWTYAVFVGVAGGMIRRKNR